MTARASSLIGDENSLSQGKVQLDPGPRNLGAITNWTGNNVTNDTSDSLLNHVPANRGPSRLPEARSWHQTNSGTLSTILLLHVIFFYQMYRQQTKKQCVVSYSQLVRRRQYFKGMLAILSHPPSEENDGFQWSSSIDFGAFCMAEGDHLVQRISARLRPLIHGRWNGVPLLLYISH